MKKTESYNIPARKATVAQRMVYICDICQEEKKSENQIKQCSLCKRDICRQCVKKDPNYFGDYPDKYCAICHDLKFNKHKDLFREIKRTYNSTLYELDNRIKKESLGI